MGTVALSPHAGQLRAWAKTQGGPPHPALGQGLGEGRPSTHSGICTLSGDTGEAERGMARK